MGIRQRFMLGRYNIRRFGAALGKNLMTPQGFFAESSDVYRTIQSGQAELIGMLYEHHKSTGAPSQLFLTDKQVASLTGSKSSAIIPFGVRRSADIQKELKSASTPEGLQTFPVYTTINIDFNYRGLFSCPYARAVSGMRAKSTKSYENIQFSKQILVQAYEKYFGKTFNMTAADFSNLDMWSLIEFADKAYAEVYDNTWDPMTNFTHQEWHTINRVITSWTEQQATPYTRQIQVTAELRNILDDMKRIMEGRENQTVKFRLLSSHDSNVANWITTLNPSLNWGDIAFAEPIQIELYDLDGDYFVRMVLSGIPLAIESCGGKLFCTIQEFSQQLHEVLFHGDLRSACEAPFVPAGGH